MSKVMKAIYITIGCLMVVLAVIGAVLPIMPTVPFLIVAVWCFQRSSTRLHDWLYQNKYLGPSLQRWNERGAISPLTKVWAVGAMMVGAILMVLFYPPPLYLLIGIISVFVAVSLYIITRPNA